MLFSSFRFSKHFLRTSFLSFVLHMIVFSHIVHSLGCLFIPRVSTLPQALSSVKRHVHFPVFNFRLQGTSLNQEIAPNISQTSSNIEDEFIEVGTRIVTDIDDTVKSSGGVKLFGIPLGGIDVSRSNHLTGLDEHLTLVNYRYSTIEASSIPEHSNLPSN
jgi:hypothetical protein